MKYSKEATAKMKKWKKLIVDAEKLEIDTKRSINYIEKLKDKLGVKRIENVSPSARQSNYSQSVMTRTSQGRSPRPLSKNVHLPKISDKLHSRNTFKNISSFNDYSDQNIPLDTRNVLTSSNSFKTPIHNLSSVSFPMSR
jgi:hypothetical protein